MDILKQNNETLDWLESCKSHPGKGSEERLYRFLQEHRNLPNRESNPDITNKRHLKYIQSLNRRKSLTEEKVGNSLNQIRKNRELKLLLRRHNDGKKEGQEKSFKKEKGYKEEGYKEEGFKKEGDKKEKSFKGKKKGGKR